MALGDIFIDEATPELVALRVEKGWPQYQMAKGLGLSLTEYANIEYGRINKPELKARIKDILENNETFSPYIFLPKLPDFQPGRRYEFITQSFMFGSRANEKKDNGRASSKCFTFVKSCEGAHGLTHYLFKDKGGSLESFTQVQLIDYRFEEADK